VLDKLNIGKKHWWKSSDRGHQIYSERNIQSA